MPAPNVYEELKGVLNEFKTFLDQNTATIKPIVTQLKALVPQIIDLINELIGLLTKLKAEIDKLDVSGIPGLDKVSAFTASVKTLLETSKKLLPNEASTIDSIAAAADVVTGLPSVGQLKAELTGALDAIVAKLNELKTA